MEIREFIETSRAYKGTAESLSIEGPFQGEMRLSLFAAFFDIAMEHHEAMMRLIEDGLTGSGFALLRLLFEAVVRGHWVAACATDDNIEQLRLGKFEFPSMRGMIDQLEATLSMGGIFESIKGKVWNGMNDYTHIGTKHLSKRLTAEYVKPNYSEGEIKEVIYNATMAAMLFCGFFCQKTGRQERVDKIVEMMGAYQDQVSIQ